MVSVAQAFGCNPRAYTAFTSAYRVSTSLNDICDEDVRRLLNGEKPKSILQRRYHSLPFPEPVLPNNERIQHLRDGEALCAAAADFSNCFHNFISTAHRNEKQFYKVVLADGSKAILTLNNDAPSGWLVDEVKLKHNEDPDQMLVNELSDHLSHFGGRNGPPVALLVQRAMRSILTGDLDFNPFDDDVHMFEMWD
jgi:hypothetical protein